MHSTLVFMILLTCGQLSLAGLDACESTTVSPQRQAKLRGNQAQNRARDPSAATPHSRPCPLRDEGEGEGEGEIEPPPGADVNDGIGGHLRHIVTIGTAFLVIAYVVPGSPLRRRSKTILLTVCAAMAIGNYMNLGAFPGDRYVNEWEFFHYYLGSKYLPELGYTRLYAAALIADEETGRKFNHKRAAIRNLVSGSCIPIDVVLKQRDNIVSHFSPDRWTAFKQDIRYFKSVLSQYRWNGVFHDKGYNATPVWSMYVGRLTNWVTTSQPIGLLGLALLDLLLIALAIAMVWRTFGNWPALLMIVLIGTHMVMSHAHMKGALLRTDWVIALVLAVCALKANRPAVSGALVAFSATSRVFPIIFAFALFAIPVIAWFRGQPHRSAHVRFVVGFLATMGALLAASIVAVGPVQWQEFVEKICQHNDSFSPWRVGFKHLFLGAYEYRADGTGTHQAVFHERWILWWSMQAIALMGFVFLVRRLKDWEILACGFIPTFLLVAPTYYYYIMLVMPLLFFAGRINRPECTAGVVWLLLSSNIAYTIYDSIGRELELFYAISCMVFGVCLLMCLSAAIQVEPQEAANSAPCLRLRTSMDGGLSPEPGLDSEPVRP